MERLVKLQNKIFRYKKINALLITNPINLNYLTSTDLFSDNNPGFGLITPSSSTLFVSPLIQQSFFPIKANKIVSIKNNAQLYSQLRIIINRVRPHVNYNNFFLGFEENNLKWQVHKQLAKKIKVNLPPTKNFVESLRIIKDNNEIKYIKRALDITHKAFNYIAKQLKPGRMEKEISWLMEKYFKEHGADTMAFPIIVAAGENSAIPHYQTGNRKINVNDIILIDAGCKINGYCSDITRTFFVGKPKQEWLKVYKIVKEAQQKAIAFINKVSPCWKTRRILKVNQVDKTCRDYIKSKGFGKYFIHSTGHGIGLDVHELPAINSKSKMILKKDIIFTIEPGIYLPGKFGVRIEDSIVI